MRFRPDILRARMPVTPGTAGRALARASAVTRRFTGENVAPATVQPARLVSTRAGIEVSGAVLIGRKALLGGAADIVAADLEGTDIFAFTVDPLVLGDPLPILDYWTITCPDVAIHATNLSVRLRRIPIAAPPVTLDTANIANPAVEFYTNAALPATVAAADTFVARIPTAAEGGGVTPRVPDATRGIAGFLSIDVTIGFRWPHLA